MLTVVNVMFATVAVYVIFVLLKTILYASLSCATFLSGVYFFGCVTSPPLFEVFGVGVSSSDIAAILLGYAAFQFCLTFFRELSVAFGKLVPLR